MDFQFGQVPAAAYGFIGLTAAVMAYATLSDSDNNKSSGSSNKDETEESNYLTMPIQKGGNNKRKNVTKRSSTPITISDIVPASILNMVTPKKGKGKRKGKNKTC
uniref:Uncharacterized protein n=1 Tax=viral metagenome TaxID=1070528 RepID=A0A6C0I4J6_9ZZZZ